MINCFRDPIHVLMRVLLFPSDDAHEEVLDGHRNGVREEEDDDIADAKEAEGQIVGDTLILRSVLRKADSNSTQADKEKKTKKKVQWVDVAGIKELADIREFEPSEEDDMDSDRGKACVCVVM